MAGARSLLASLLAAALLVTGCGAGQGVRGAAPRPRGDRIPTPSQTLITPAPPEATEAVQKRPNVLVIEADDMRWDDLRFMPNVRRLIQAKGLTFENSFAPYPLCCPSRASFLSGQYAHNHHVYSHLDPYGFAAFDDRRTIARVLQQSGYHTALIGKYLNGYGHQAVRATGLSSLHYVPPGWDQWMAGSDHQWQPGDPVHGGTYDYFDLVQNVNGHVHASPGRYSTDVLAEQTRSVIDGFRRGPKPWFVWWTPVAPHHGDPVEADDPTTTPRSDGGSTRWLTPARPDWVKGRFDQMVTHGAGTPAHGSAERDVSDKPFYLRKMPELNAAERAAETALTRQRAESLFVLDIQIGRTISRLSQTGQLANTVLMFTSDNGVYLGEHRKRQGKINLHEPSLRVPLLIAGPGIPHGRRYDPVTTVDLAPTLAAYAGRTMPGADGIDLAAMIRRGDRGWNRAVVTEGMMPETLYVRNHLMGPVPLNTRGLRLGRWKVTRYSTGETEIYDLRHDPLELRNLARVPEYAGVRHDLVRLFRRYRDCREDACRVPLPPAYRLGAPESRQLTQDQVRRTNAYFGN